MYSPDPFNRRQVSHLSLRPEDVTIIVFRTRSPQPLIPYLKGLDQLGYRYYFQYTVMNNPRLIDTMAPPLSSSLKIFKKLSDLIGPERVIWRYGPVILSNITDIEVYNTCLSGCQYCYATSSFEKAKVIYKNHNPDSTSIVDYGD